MKGRAFFFILSSMAKWFLICALMFSGCLSESDTAINTDKLTGTPFEGRSTGDDFGWSAFRSGDYFTSQVDAVPIPVFLAYFSSSQESEIAVGIEMANDAVGFEVYRAVDTWQNDARVIYKVSSVGDEAGGFPDEFYSENPAITIPSLLLFDGKSIAATVVTDWQIELRASSGIDRWFVAHELCHAMGVQEHRKIDYDADAYTDLEADSIMQGDVFPDNPQMNDYNFMMQRQGEILLEHLGEGPVTDTE